MNVIIILLDTLRWDALGCYRSDWVQTPCIDHYAQRAVRFTEARCASFPTVPQRSDAYTGDVNWPRYGWKGPDQDQPKLPLLLRDAGYYTALILDTQNNVGAGFHQYFHEYHLIRKDVDDGITAHTITFPAPRENMRQNGRLYAEDRARWSQYRHEEDWFGVRTMRRACRWLEDNARKGKFLLWVDSFEIHEDWMPPSYYVDLYDSGYQGFRYTYPNYGYTDVYQPHELGHLRACYAGEVTLMDRWVGHLLRQVELLGLMEDTCIILTSDHGMYIGEHGRAGKHTVNPEDPWPIYDTVARIPLLVWVPFPTPRRTISALVQPADILPTALDLCGVSAPTTFGKSWVPLLKGQADAGHDVVFTSYHSGAGPGGSPVTQSHITVTTDRYTALFGRQPHRPELYDRTSDPEQLHDISDESIPLLEGLRAQLIAFMKAQGADEKYIRTYAMGE